MEDDIIIEDIETPPFQVNVENDNVIKDFETQPSSANAGDDIVIEDIETPPSKVNVEDDNVIKDFENQPSTANAEEDIVFEDIETPASPVVSIGVLLHEISNLENTMTENRLSTCLPGIGLIIQTLNKYFKNTLMSLLMLSYLLPTILTLLYGRITKSGCENPTFRFMIEINEYFLVFIADIFLPYLIKLKLDRLSN